MKRGEFILNKQFNMTTQFDLIFLNRLNLYIGQIGIKNKTY
jgi:hypothetical protein